MESDVSVILSDNKAYNTSLLLIIAGLENPYQGKVVFKGNNINSSHINNPDIAVVFDKAKKIRNITLFDQLFKNAKKNNNKSDISCTVTVKLVAGHLGLTSSLYTDTYYYAEDFLARISLAMAFVKSAKVIVIDDIFNNLAENSQDFIRKAISLLTFELNKTVVAALTSPSAALALATSIIVMNSGSVEQTGSPREIYYSPKNWFVASFIGKPSINNFLIKDSYFENKKLYVKLSIGVNIVIEEIKTRSAFTAITLSVRPEHLQIGSSIPVVVVRTEFVNGNTIVYARTSVRNTEVNFLYSGRKQFEYGDQIFLDIDKDNVYIFDYSLNRIT